MSQVTRFGPNPTVDREVATKFYVDNSGGGGGGYFILQSPTPNISAGGTFYASVYINWVNDINSATESLVDVPIHNAFTVIRNISVVILNTKNKVSTVAFRADGVTIGLNTIPASTNGTFDSGVLAVAVASGEAINYRHIHIAGTGALRYTTQTECTT